MRCDGFTIFSVVVETEKKMLYCPLLVISLLLPMASVEGSSVFSWVKKDRFDQLDAHFHSVNGRNCRAKSKQALLMRRDVVSQVPVYNQLLSKVWYSNRSSLIHLHNMAYNRALFYSYILQRLNDSSTFSSLPDQNYLYFSVAADINSNPSGINGSSIYFDTNCYYPNWIPVVPFNKTLDLFAPKAFRWDDTKDQDNYLRETTRTVVKLTDAGAGQNRNYTHPGFKMNPWYTMWLPDLDGHYDSLRKFTYNVYYNKENESNELSDGHSEHFAFFGPSLPGATTSDHQMFPVQFTEPYFDCGGSNKWVLGAVSPVVDYMPRYSNFTHMRRPLFVGVVAMEIDLNTIDFNSCDIGAGNPGPSYLAGLHKCKPSTSCKHKAGLGLRRGGYYCECNAGTRGAWYLETPYQGANIEAATEEEYAKGFDCTQNQNKMVIPVVNEYSYTAHSDSKRIFSGFDINTLTNNITKPVLKAGVMKREIKNTKRDTKDHGTLMQWDETSNASAGREMLLSNTVNIKERQQKRINQASDALLSQYTNITGKSRNTRLGTRQLETSNGTRRGTRRGTRHGTRQGTTKINRRKRSSVFDDRAYDRMMRLLRHKNSVTPDNCRKFLGHTMTLPGDVSYGVSKQFENEGRTAVRLSHFLSLYFQHHTLTGFSSSATRSESPRLHAQHMMGELLANVMGNPRIVSSGLFFDSNKFVNELGVILEQFGRRAYRKSGSFHVMDLASQGKSSYVEQDWFQLAKSRFQNNYSGLKTYKVRAYTRVIPNGASIASAETFPAVYRAATYELGHWTKPYFRCDGSVDAWVMMFVSPFFGLDSLKTKLEFRGVSTVEVPLDLLAINQCPQPFNIANAFKNTAMCDYFSTKCIPLEGFHFQRGAYACKCRMGFEYWHSDGKKWFEGSFLEIEYQKKKAGHFSRFDHLYCRRADAVRWTASSNLLLLLMGTVWASKAV